MSPRNRLLARLGAGLALIFAAAIGFAEVAQRTAADRPLAIVDRQITDWFHQHGTALLTAIARGVSFFGSVRFLACASLLVAVVLWRKERWNRLLVFAFAMLGESALDVALKHLFHRARPVLENPLVTLSSYGFPSGHTMGATVFYGLLALLIAQPQKRRVVRVAIVLSASVIICCIALSRVYLGAHYTSDVIGALCAGVAWITLCWLAVVTFWREER